MLSPAAAFSLKKGDVLYHEILTGVDKGGDTVSLTATVVGKAKPHGSEEFALPVRINFGDGKTHTITKYGESLWRTTPEREQPPQSLKRGRRALVG